MKKIFGQTTINISNGIDFSSITMKTHINNTSKSLHFIGVAEIHYWHGFDRFLKGMHLYYQTPVDYKIYFHIVGSPTAEREQKEIIDYIKEKYLEEYVILHGRQYGTELDKLFDLADIGVGSLARHRTQIDKIKPLKNREYAARGIPFIFSETDADFENMPYIYKIPADESPVSIKDILTFFRKMNLTPSEIRNSISNLSWNKQMEKVIKEVNIKL